MQWGAWSSIGMAASNQALLARIQRSGMGVLAPRAGLAALHAVLGMPSTSQVAQPLSMILTLCLQSGHSKPLNRSCAMDIG